MIKTYRQVPEYYYNESRDFQFIGRIFEAVLNHSKTAIDCLKNNPLSRDSDPRLLDLVATTFGFESKHPYDVNDLKALCNSFASILRIKGTKKAIEDCVRVLLKSQNINEKFDVIIQTDILNGDDTVFDRSVTIYVPSSVGDIALLEDMLDYVLPAGFTYEIVTATVVKQKPVTDIGYAAEINYSGNISTPQLGSVTRGMVELSDDEIENAKNANAGITDNTAVIRGNEQIVEETQ